MLEIIIFSISILILVSLGFLFLWVKESSLALFCFSFVIPCVILLHRSIDKPDNPGSRRTLTISGIKEYQIDSTITILGIDTTKTYTITYFK